MGATLLAHSKTALASALVFAGALGWALWFALELESTPERCTPGLTLVGSRCCAPGQTLVEGRCHGPPESCPSEMILEGNPARGCVAQHQILFYSGGLLLLAPVDWDSEQTMKEEFHVAAFRLDSHEVTAARYERCGAIGACTHRAPLAEPGLPMTALSADQAERYCAHVGGRLPTPEEWMFAAMGTSGRRYPWGPHGLACRRSAYGLTEGPCDTRALGPELAGARSLGASPEGAHDLSGNVAELTRDASGKIFAMGGSFRSRFPSQVKAWARFADPGLPREDLGFRCAYPVRAR